VDVVVPVAVFAVALLTTVFDDGLFTSLEQLANTVMKIANPITGVNIFFIVSVFRMNQFK
jgi:hypothetical protein